jgi:catechol 2,3-dioxygenase-like lactoylglutathione lyase family enzyme
MATSTSAAAWSARLLLDEELRIGNGGAVSGERTHPILPCPDLDEAVSFYEALGFHRTYRQSRPNPYAVMAFEDIVIHLAGIDGFDPATSVSSVIILVPDADGLHASFAEGLRLRYGRLPATGIPRILRPRRKQGTATGFSVVDVGGNWLRVYRAGESEDDLSERAGGLTRVIEIAARQGDARGDDARALAILERGLVRHAAAAPVERVRALLYQAELLARLGQHERATTVLVTAARTSVPEQDRAAVAADVAHAREVVSSSAEQC